MTIVKENNEIVVRIPENINAQLLEGILDYLKAKSILSKSKATQQNADQLSNEIEKDWWKKNKKRLIG